MIKGMKNNASLSDAESLNNIKYIKMLYGSEMVHLTDVGIIAESALNGDKVLLTRDLKVLMERKFPTKKSPSIKDFEVVGNAVVVYSRDDESSPTKVKLFTLSEISDSKLKALPRVYNRGLQSFSALEFFGKFVAYMAYYDVNDIKEDVFGKNNEMVYMNYSEGFILFDKDLNPIGKSGKQFFETIKAADKEVKLCKDKGRNSNTLAKNFSEDLFKLLLKRTVIESDDRIQFYDAVNDYRVIEAKLDDGEYVLREVRDRA